METFNPYNEKKVFLISNWITLYNADTVEIVHTFKLENCSNREIGRFLEQSIISWKTENYE